MIQHWGVEKRCYYVSQTQKKLMRVPLAELVFWYLPGFFVCVCVFFPDDVEIDGLLGPDWWNITRWFSYVGFLESSRFLRVFSISGEWTWTTRYRSSIEICLGINFQEMLLVFSLEGGITQLTLVFCLKGPKQKQAVSAQVIIKRVWTLRNVHREFPKKTAGREAQRDVGNENEERKKNAGLVRHLPKVD